jgi:hypothetical protein
MTCAETPITMEETPEITTETFADGVRFCVGRIDYIKAFLDVELEDMKRSEYCGYFQSVCRTKILILEIAKELILKEALYHGFSPEELT